MNKIPLNRAQMAARVAREFQDDWVVNLGIGIPTLCSNYCHPEKRIIFQSENGVIGCGPLAAEGSEDFHLVNAGGQHITLIPGASIVHHADSFAIIRGGHVDVTVMGSYEVAENGDFANWKLHGRKGGSIGGAMDLAIGAKRVFIIMDHTTRDGRPRLLKQLTLPATARMVVDLVMTNLGLFQVTPEGFMIREIASGYELQDVQELTDAQLAISPTLKEIDLFC